MANIDFSSSVIARLEICIWQNELLESELNCIKESVSVFSRKESDERLRKLSAYSVFLDKVKFFSILFSQANEANEDFHDTLALILGGHYKASLLMMRSHFEIKRALLGAIKSNQPIDKFLVNRSAESRHALTKPLEIDEEWKQSIDELYGKLSKFNHSTGRSDGHSQLNPLPKPIFNSYSYELCMTLLNEVIDNTVVLWKARIPRMVWNKIPNDDIEKGALEYLYAHIDNQIAQNRLRGLKV